MAELGDKCDFKKITSTDEAGEGRETAAAGTTTEQ
jgi:hypothetical protein